MLVESQRLRHQRGQPDHSATALTLRLDKCHDAADPLQCLANANRRSVKIHVVPMKAKHLAQAKSARDCETEESLKRSPRAATSKVRDSWAESTRSSGRLAFGGYAKAAALRLTKPIVMTDRSSTGKVQIRNVGNSPDVSVSTIS